MDIVLTPEHKSGQFERLKNVWGLDDDELEAFKTSVYKLIDLKLKRHGKKMSKTAKDALANLLAGMLVEETKFQK